MTIVITVLLTWCGQMSDTPEQKHHRWDSPKMLLFPRDADETICDVKNTITVKFVLCRTTRNNIPVVTFGQIFAISLQYVCYSLSYICC